jgi:hypothetical protein
MDIRAAGGVTYALWALLLVTQQFSHGLSSRAKNSSSVAYNCLASIMSNGVWFASNLILVDNFVDILRRSAWSKAVWIGVFYLIFTVSGSVLSQLLAMKWTEKRWDVK